jgi:hypothetical protein
LKFDDFFGLWRFPSFSGVRFGRSFRALGGRVRKAGFFPSSSFRESKNPLIMALDRFREIFTEIPDLFFHGRIRAFFRETRLDA